MGGKAVRRRRRITLLGLLLFAGCGTNTSDERVTVPAGTTFAAVTDSLVAHGVVSNRLWFKVLARVRGADRSVRAGEWKRSKFGGVELRGRTLGLIGSGRIGSEVGKRCKAFEMKVIASDPFLTEERARELGFEKVELDELKRRADVIPLHVPLNEQTRGMFDEAGLRSLKKGAFLVNVARGGVVDEKALV